MATAAPETPEAPRSSSSTKTTPNSTADEGVDKVGALRSLSIPADSVDTPLYTDTRSDRAPSDGSTPFTPGRQTLERGGSSTGAILARGDDSDSKDVPLSPARSDVPGTLAGQQALGQSASRNRTLLAITSFATAGVRDNLNASEARQGQLSETSKEKLRRMMRPGHFYRKVRVLAREREMNFMQRYDRSPWILALETLAIVLSIAAYICETVPEVEESVRAAIDDRVWVFAELGFTVLFTLEIGLRYVAYWFSTRQQDGAPAPAFDYAGKGTPANLAGSTAGSAVGSTAGSMAGLAQTPHGKRRGYTMMEEKGTAFWGDPRVWIDIFSVIPFYFRGLTCETMFAPVDSCGAGVRWLGAIKILRAFKLARHFKGTGVLVTVMKRVGPVLLIPLLFLGISAMVYAVVVFIIETTVPSDIFCDAGGESAFVDVVSTSYFSVVTMTTVGYGDQVPMTTAGKLVAVLVMMWGVLFTAMPLTIVGNEFYVAQAEFREARELDRRPKTIKWRAREHLPALLESNKEELYSSLVESYTSLGAQLNALNRLCTQSSHGITEAEQLDMQATMSMTLLGMDALFHSGFAMTSSAEGDRFDVSQARRLLRVWVQRHIEFMTEFHNMTEPARKTAKGTQVRSTNTDGRTMMVKMQSDGQYIAVKNREEDSITIAAYEQRRRLWRYMTSLRFSRLYTLCVAIGSVSWMTETYPPHWLSSDELAQLDYRGTMVHQVVYHMFNGIQALAWIAFAATVHVEDAEEEGSKPEVFSSRVLLLFDMVPIALWITELVLLAVGFESISLYHVLAAPFMTLRIARVAAGIAGLRVLGHTLRDSVTSLGIPLFFFGIAALVFATLLYQAEVSDSELALLDIRNDEHHCDPDSISDMLRSLWVVIATLTSVGYGDISPKSMWGRLIAALAMVFGLVYLAMPISVVGSSFSDNWHRHTQRREPLVLSLPLEFISLRDEFQAAAKKLAAAIIPLDWEVSFATAGGRQRSVSAGGGGGGESYRSGLDKLDESGASNAGGAPGFVWPKRGEPDVMEMLVHAGMDQVRRHHRPPRFSDRQHSRGSLGNESFSEMGDSGTIATVPGLHLKAPPADLVEAVHHMTGVYARMGAALDYLRHVIRGYRPTPQGFVPPPLLAASRLAADRAKLAASFAAMTEDSWSSQVWASVRRVVCCARSHQATHPVPTNESLKQSYSTPTVIARVKDSGSGGSSAPGSSRGGFGPGAADVDAVPPVQMRASVSQGMDPAAETSSAPSSEPASQRASTDSKPNDGTPPAAADKRNGKDFKLPGQMDGSPR